MPTTLTGNPANGARSPAISGSAPAAADLIASGAIDTLLQKILDYIAFFQTKAAILDDTSTFTVSPNVPVPSAAAHPLRKDAVLARSNLPSVGQQVSGSSGTFSTTSTGFVDVTNLSVTITTTGRPVVLALVSDGAGSAAFIAAGATGASAGASAFFRLLRDTTEIAKTQMNYQGSAAGNLPAPPGAFGTMDVVGAGTYTYKVQANVAGVLPTAYVNNCKLVAYEL